MHRLLMMGPEGSGKSLVIETMAEKLNGQCFTIIGDDITPEGLFANVEELKPKTLLFDNVGPNVMRLLSSMEEELAQRGVEYIIVAKKS